jgi:hypothetical protein
MVENEIDTVPKESLSPARGGLMKRTLRELQMLEVKLKDVFSVSDVTINLSWDQVIKLVNYNAGRNVLNWDHTFEEALEVIKIFLL